MNRVSGCASHDWRAYGYDQKHFSKQPDESVLSASTGSKARTVAAQVDRRMFELCVLFQVANDLKSGDLCIASSDRFRDYRLELLSWEKVGQLRKQLEDRGRGTDKGFPENRYLRFENGEPILTPVEAARPQRSGAGAFIHERASGSNRNS
jgi:hypothetical protein